MGDASAVEGGLVSFTIGLDPVSDREVTVKWSTANDAGGTHPAGAADYTTLAAPGGEPGADGDDRGGGGQRASGDECRPPRTAWTSPPRPS